MISFETAQELVERELRIAEEGEQLDRSFYREDDEYFHIPVIRREGDLGVGAPSYLVRKSDGKVETPVFHPYLPFGKRMMNMTRVDLT